MSIRQLVVEYRFEDETINKTMVNPGENERNFLADVIKGNKSVTKAVTGLGLKEVRISYEDWSGADLFV